MELFDPALLPWWGWLLCSLAFVAAGSFAMMFVESGEGCLPASFGMAFYLVAFLAGATGLIRFVKFVWAG